MEWLRSSQDNEKPVGILLSLFYYLILVLA